MRFAFTLTPTESRRLIAKAVVQMKEMKKALAEAYIIIIGGTTTAFIVQELLGKEAIAPHSFPKGISNRGVLCQSHKESCRQILFVLHQGVAVDKTPAEVFQDFHPDSVIIKGANAIDADGNAGVLISNPTGGSMAQVFGTVTSQGLTLIVPVGLEKMVPSVKKSVKAAGASRLDYSIGCGFGMCYLANGIITTEIESLRLLCGVETTHVASGGVGGSEGAVTLVSEGEESDIREAVRLISSIKGEPRVSVRKNDCAICEHYRCAYQGLKEEELPLWLREG